MNLKMKKIGTIQDGQEIPGDMLYILFYKPEVIFE